MHIDESYHWTYTEIKEFIENKEKLKSTINEQDDLKIDELVSYMNEFIDRVDNEYLAKVRGYM